MKKKDFWAILWALALLYVGTFVLVYLLLFYSGLLDYYVFHHAFTLVNKAKSMTDITVEIFRNVMQYQSFVGIGWGITIILNAALFGFAGWLVRKKAVNKAWYMPLIPAAIIFFFVVATPNPFLKIPMAHPYIMDFIKPYFIAVCFLMSFIGGFSEKHILLRYKK